MTATRQRAIIIGGGPGGLATAVALAKAGLEPVVYECTAESQGIGSGLTLWPNGIKALDILGLGKAVRAAGRPMEGIAMCSRDGERLFQTTPGRMESYFGETGLALHRAELMALLFQALREHPIYFGADCTGFQLDNAGVTAYFDNGMEAHGDFLVGADGIKSVVRTQLFGQAKLRYAGYTVWRGVANFELEPVIGLVSMGRGAQFGLFPMAGKRVYWFASINTLPGALNWPRDHKQVVLERFGEWHKPIAAVIQATEAANILRNDIYDLDPLPCWSKERATLLGDAAHAATPALGQGACQAFEDAVVLADCVGQGQDITSALQAYEARRLGRTKSITVQSRWIGQIGQLENPVVCWLRDKFIKNTPGYVSIQQMRQMFSFEV